MQSDDQSTHTSFSVLPPNATFSQPRLMYIVTDVSHWLHVNTHIKTPPCCQPRSRSTLSILQPRPHKFHITITTILESRSAVEDVFLHSRRGLYRHLLRLCVSPTPSTRSILYSNHGELLRSFHGERLLSRRKYTDVMCWHLKSRVGGLGVYRV